MLTALSAIGVAVAGGAVGAAIVVFLLFTVRSATMEAFRQSAALEMESMRARYTRDLEEKRQEFARELERERQEAARALELFKSELGDRGEMRRQVIAKRIAALEEIAGAGEPLVREFAASSNGRDVSAKLSSLSHFTAVMRQNSHLLPASLQHHLFANISRIDLAIEKSKQVAQGGDGIVEAWRASEEVMQRVRAELGFDEPPDSSANHVLDGARALRREL